MEDNEGLDICVQFKADLEELLSEFESRFSDFSASEDAFRLFTDPFSVDVISAPEYLQLELIRLRNSSILRTKHREGSILEFYESLDRASFPGLRNHAERHISFFGSTYICEQSFSVMNHNKSQIRSRLTDRNLENIVRVATTSLEPDIVNLVNGNKSNKSH